jgi:glycosyltransferase involved in cell wall biosynthesis
LNLLWIRATLDINYGGPVAAITQLTTTIQKMGHHCEVVSLDARDFPGIVGFTGVVHALGPSWGKYCLNTRLLPWLHQNVARFDAVIVSGIWQFPSFAVWLASQKKHFPYFIFVHGALGPWAKHTYPMKHVKKWLYWPWAEYRVLRDASAVFFTSEEERGLASKSFWLYKANEVVVNYGIASPPGDAELQREMFLDKYPDLRGRRLILFLSRIHQQKGCDLLLRAFAQMAHRHKGLHLVIAGPDPVGWQTHLRRQASELGVERRITWTGMLSGDLKWGAFHAAEVFILPSHSDSFGVAIVEALACNLPVLITDKVNIWREIIGDNAGIVGPDTLEGVTRLLQEWLWLSEEERRTMGKNARRCFLTRFEIKNAAEILLQKINAITRNDVRNHGKSHERGQNRCE